MTLPYAPPPAPATLADIAWSALRFAAQLVAVSAFFAAVGAAVIVFGGGS